VILDATVSEILLAGEASYRKPDFLRPDQAFLANLKIAEDRTSAFTSRNLNASVFFERFLTRRTMAGAGTGFRVSHVEQSGAEDDFALGSLPLRFSWDARNDLLDPTRGGRVDLDVTPFVDVRDPSARFVRGYLSTTGYVPVTTGAASVLAFRMGLGFTAGAERNAIPADLRFYAGGGGSIRGYPYQSVGPLSGETPLGGRSLLELSTELRLRIAGNIGMVAFVDGGSAFAAGTPGGDERLLWGAGAGFRYYTGFGPLRVDVAFPLDRRPSLDDSFQIYVSLGQAY
jgi:translocation and assembly module TamA